MKNIILQHWFGPMNELVEKSSQNISDYAKRIGADYELVRGIVFKPRIAHKMDIPCQKLVYLDEKYDEYDNVLMLDADMFAVKGLEKNIFEVERGIGRHQGIQSELRLKLLHMKGMRWGSVRTPYWGGETFMMSREFRQNFRKVLDEQVCMAFARHYHDEGIMFALANRLGITEDQETAFGQPIYQQGKEWSWSSWEPEVEKASFVHIRRKRWTDGPKRDKILNYYELVEKGILPE